MTRQGRYGASEHFQRQRKTTHVLGVDSGATGGVTLLHLKKGYIEYSATLDDVEHPADLLGKIPLGYCMEVFIEKVHAMPGQGVSTMFTFGQNFGRIEMAVASHLGWQAGILMHYVPASVWTRHVIRSKAPHPKLRARETALKLWPLDQLRESERSKVPHPGIVDSALIAEYGRRQLLQNT